MKTLALLIIAGIMSAVSYSASAVEMDCQLAPSGDKYICLKPITPAPDDKPKPPAPKPKPQP